MADLVSFLAGCWLLVVCIMIGREYWPNRWRDLSPPEMLGMGIFLGFMIQGFNTAWWQILNTMNASIGWLPPAKFTEIGRYLDVVFKGGSAIAGMIHLAAKRKQLRNRNAQR